MLGDRCDRCTGSTGLKNATGPHPAPPTPQARPIGTILDGSPKGKYAAIVQKIVKTHLKKMSKNIGKK